MFVASSHLSFERHGEERDRQRLSRIRVDKHSRRNDPRNLEPTHGALKMPLASPRPDQTAQFIGPGLLQLAAGSSLQAGASG
jgi:hypothetical protein